jgi:putative membrane-bound dehydrogenase-like protein
MRLILACFAAFAFATPLLAAPDSDRDEPQARSPQASLESMVARAGFQVELMACEPLTMDPVAFAWGADGKLWVVEMADYPLGVDGKGTPGGRVRFLEDRDGDDKYDTSTLFLDGLSYPNGVMPWRKGVLVTCAPEIFYAEDTDGDGKADLRKPLYRGFGEGNPQHRVNGLRWGLDNWVYCANGDSGGGIISLSTSDKINIGGRDFRIRPDEGRIEAQTGQSQFMRERDDWGNWFGNSNSNPMYHFVLNDHYLRRNPHLSPPDPRVAVSVAPGAAPVFPASRTPPRFNDQNALNRFTSACSSIIYRDTLFGPQFVGNSFVCEPVHNLVHREVLYADGVTFHSRRGDGESRSEFLASTDNWSRPAMVRVGPDGALWVADMYRQVIEHPEWIPKEVQARYDLRAGHDKGRIYRVVPVGVRPRPIPRLNRLDTAGLVAALDSPSGWQRDMVQQLLIERGDRAAKPSLKALLIDEAKPVLVRLHALCTLDGLHAIDAELLRQSLGIHPGISRHVVRLSEPFLDQSPELAAAVAGLVDSDDPQLLMQLAYSLGEWHSVEAGRALGRLALFVTGSAYIEAAILSSATKENLPGLAEAVFNPPNDAAGLEGLSRQTAMLAVVLKSKESLAALVRSLPSHGEVPAEWQLAMLEGLFDGLNRGHLSLAELGAREGGEVLAALPRIGKLLAAARETATKVSADETKRLHAIKLLGRLPDDRAADLKALHSLLSPQTSAAVQSAAMVALSAIGDDSVPAMLLAGWQGFGPELRGQAVDSLLGREAWLRHLLNEIESNHVAAVAIDAARRQRILQHSKEDIRRQAEKLFAGAADANRQQVVDRYREALKLVGDRERGAAVFKKSCATCHRLGEVGRVVGPDLSALSDRSPSAMLIAVFDPNRAVEAKFLNYTAVTTDGVTYTGMLASEAGGSVTLLAADGKEVPLLRGDLEALVSSAKSLMPEGLEKDLAPQDVADLLAYLSGFRPPRKKFDGNEPKLVTPEALRGELWLLAQDSEIYGKTLVFEPPYRNLGYWQTDDDHALWSLKVTKPGKYAISLDYACDNSAAGQTAAVEIAGHRLMAKIAGTGNWDTYRTLQLGQVELPSGVQQLLVRPDGRLHGPLMDLKSVRLRPVK